MQTDSEFWQDDAAALANREAQRSIEARTGLRMPAPSSARPPEKPSTFRPAQGQELKPVTAKPQPSTKMVVATLIVLAFMLFLMFGPKPKQEPNPKHGVGGSMLPEQEKQLRSVVSELIGTGVLLKVTTGDPPEMYVLPAFHLLDVDRKTQIVTAVYHVSHKLAIDGKECSEKLYVYDGLTGEHLRTFDKSFWGLQW